MKPKCLIFLDVDGVLNGYTPLNIFIAEKLYSLNVLWIKQVFHNWNIFGVRFWKVFLLSILCHILDANVVVSSTWRYGFNHSFLDCDREKRLLKIYFKIFGIKVIGITPSDRESNGIRRDKEIQKYITDHDFQNIPYIILDDEPTMFKHDMEHLVQTSDIPINDIGRCDPVENTGLRFKHIIQAIKLYKKEKKKAFL